MASICSKRATSPSSAPTNLDSHHWNKSRTKIAQKITSTGHLISKKTQVTFPNAQPTACWTLSGTLPTPCPNLSKTCLKPSPQPILLEGFPRICSLENRPQNPNTAPGTHPRAKAWNWLKSKHPIPFWSIANVFGQNPHKVQLPTPCPGPCWLLRSHFEPLCHALLKLLDSDHQIASHLVIVVASLHQIRNGCVPRNWIFQRFELVFEYYQQYHTKSISGPYLYQETLMHANIPQNLFSSSNWDICLFRGGSVDQWDQPPRANSTHASTKVEIFLASREAKKQEATRSQMIYRYFTSIFASSVSVSMLIVIESRSPF